jgi:site-specific DNA-cytosine methylase
MTAYKDLSDEEKQIIIQKNLEYYYKNRQKINVRTHIYHKEYYIKNKDKILAYTKTYNKSDKYRKYSNENEKKRRLTIEECEILQTFPINYTSCISNTQRYKALGNSWTVDVIVHIFNHIIK